MKKRTKEEAIEKDPVVLKNARRRKVKKTTRTYVCGKKSLERRMPARTFLGLSLSLSLSLSLQKES